MMCLIVRNVPLAYVYYMYVYAYERVGCTMRKIKCIQLVTRDVEYMHGIKNMKTKMN